MEGDPTGYLDDARENHFNPLPPHGGRHCAVCGILDDDGFQSTPSAWRETNTIFRFCVSIVFQSTPSAWRETQYKTGVSVCLWNFNPLPPHGGRPVSDCNILYCTEFQSTPSAWRETFILDWKKSHLKISIHSLRMEGDLMCDII